MAADGSRRGSARPGRQSMRRRRPICDKSMTRGGAAGPTLPALHAPFTWRVLVSAAAAGEPTPWRRSAPGEASPARSRPHSDADDHRRSTPAIEARRGSPPARPGVRPLFCMSGSPLPAARCAAGPAHCAKAVVLLTVALIGSPLTGFKGSAGGVSACRRPSVRFCRPARSPRRNYAQNKWGFCANMQKRPSASLRARPTIAPAGAGLRLPRVRRPRPYVGPPRILCRLRPLPLPLAWGPARARAGQAASCARGGPSLAVGRPARAGSVLVAVLGGQAVSSGPSGPPV